ncbi:hypothetical protein CDAR_191081 [Caerostris darwini]|uniref:Uncharacterized protein n=1 Tax=Caerostris darwini TaxID=1538125 RepID=A0AAV4PMH9_9ARAC|nr:hypothetical protein CDAR_191081 [Caerostris darwini]
MSNRKFSIGDSDEDDIESEPSTTSRFGLLRISDDIEEDENKENVQAMSTSEVMPSTSLLEENPEVESLDSEEILADKSIKPEINEDPESEELQPKKETASPTFDPSLPGPSGCGRIVLAELESFKKEDADLQEFHRSLKSKRKRWDSSLSSTSSSIESSPEESSLENILSEMKCSKRMEPIKEQKNDEREEPFSEDNVPSCRPVSPIVVEDLSSNMRHLMNKSLFKLHKKKVEEIALYFPLRVAAGTPQSSPEMLESNIIGLEKMEPVVITETERWTSTSSSSLSSSNQSTFERIEPVTEDVKKFVHVKKGRKRKKKCSSVLPSTTISSSMRNTSEASSVHEPKAESDVESLVELEAERKHKKIKLEEISPGSNLPGTSISSSSACKSIESDVKGLEEPKSGKKRKRKTKCSSPVLPMITISSAMQNTSEASSVHEHKTESDEKSLEDLESGRKLKKIKLEEIAPGTDLPGPSSSSSSACKKTESDEESLEDLKSGRKLKKIKLEEIAPGTDLPGPSSSSSSACKKTEPDDESLEDLKSGRKLKKIKLEEIAPGTDLPGPSSSSSSACKNTESDVKVLLEPGEKHDKSKSEKCTEGSDPKSPKKPE